MTGRFVLYPDQYRINPDCLWMLNKIDNNFKDALTRSLSNSTPDRKNLVNFRELGWEERVDYSTAMVRYPHTMRTPSHIYNNIHYMYTQFLFTLLTDFQIDFLSWFIHQPKKKIDWDKVKRLVTLSIVERLWQNPSLAPGFDIVNAFGKDSDSGHSDSVALRS